jgi:hypothetical protein
VNQFENELGFLDRYREFFVSRGHLTSQQFDDAVSKSRQVRALNLLPGVWWGVTPQLASQFPNLLTSVKLEAQAVGLKLPFPGLGGYIARMPPLLLKRTTWAHVPAPRPGQKIGSLFRDLGLISNSELAQILGIQQLIRDETGTDPSFGMLAMRTAAVSLVDLLQVVGIQKGLPFENPEQFIQAYEKKFNSCACP